MVNVRSRNCRPAVGLRQNERTLQHGLCVQRQTLSSPRGANPMALHRRSNVGLNLGGMSKDARRTCRTDFRVRAIDFLDHRADKTGELRDLPFEERLAKIE